MSWIPRLVNVPGTKRHPTRTVLFARAVLLAAILMVGAEVARTALGTNLHTVVPHRCYRCAQPTPDQLRVMTQALGIRTVVNLRGFDAEPWYAAERNTAERLGLVFADAGLWASTQPEVDEFQTIVHAIDDSPEPLLIHCQSGIDRSGLASAIFLLLKTDASLTEAAGQLGLRFGHNPWGKAGCQDRLLAAYGAWLVDEGSTHSSDRFRRWAYTEYRPEKR